MRPIAKWLALSLWSMLAMADPSEELGDLAGRLQFDYYAGDARALQRDLQRVDKLAPEIGRMRDYHLAYGYWKLAELLAARERSAARKAVESCIDAADRGLDQVPKRANLPRPDVTHAELHAIQAGCYLMQSELSGFASASRASKSLDEARALQPSNARVLLVAAMQMQLRAKSEAERKAAESALAAAVAAFDSQPPTAVDAPDWGQAEALARLGEAHLHMGDRVAARDAIERALVLAPDYAFARTLLSRITGAR